MPPKKIYINKIPVYHFSCQTDLFQSWGFFSSFSRFIKTHHTKNSVIPLDVLYKRNFLNLDLLQKKKKSGNHYNPPHSPIRYSSFLLQYFPVYTYITTCHRYVHFCLSLLLSCEIPSGRSYLYFLSIPIKIPSMQDLLSAALFF